MRPTLLLPLLLLTAICAAPAVAAPDRWTLEVETGPVWPGYNDVRIPNDETGTRFSLSDDLAMEETWVVRGRLGYALSPRSTLWALVAPLTVNAAGSVDREIRFAGETFAPGAALDAEYRFNSYRLSYLYEVAAGPSFALAIGATAKIREAHIELRDDGRSASKDDVNVVPLVGFDARLALAGPLALQIAGDALAAPQGRAEDVRAVLRWTFAPDRAAFAGYRLLEGGADVDAVYTFALFHYAVAGVSLGF